MDRKTGLRDKRPINEVFRIAIELIKQPGDTAEHPYEPLFQRAEITESALKASFSSVDSEHPIIVGGRLRANPTAPPNRARNSRSIHQYLNSRRAAPPCLGTNVTGSSYR
jgi:hypothetical protein